MARYTRAIPVTKSDTAANVFDAFHVANDGNIHIETAGGDNVVLAVEAGSIYPIAVRRVFNTDTTVGDVHGLA